MPTLVNVTAEASWLTNALSAIESATQLDRQATIKSDPNLVSWLRADTCFASFGTYPGWRDRVSGQLLVQKSGTVAPTETPLAAFNNQPAIQWPVSNGGLLNDNGANLFPAGNQDLSFIAVCSVPAGGFGVIFSDGGTASTGLVIQQDSGSHPQVYAFGAAVTGSAFPAVTGGAAWFLIGSYKYGGGSPNDMKFRLNGGSYTYENNAVTGNPSGGVLTLAGYSGSGPFVPAIAEIIVFKAAILHGSYLTNTFANWSNQALYQVIEAYVQTRYNV